jgi:hypothetical protein
MDVTDVENSRGVVPGKVVRRCGVRRRESGYPAKSRPRCCRVEVVCVHRRATSPCNLETVAYLAQLS